MSSAQPATIDLKVTAGIDIEKALSALKRQSWEEFSQAQPWEFNNAAWTPSNLEDVASFSRRLRARRLEAFGLFRKCMDEWIKSGRHSADQTDRPANRSFLRSPHATQASAAFWRESRKIMQHPGVKTADEVWLQLPPVDQFPALRLLPPESPDPEEPIWYANRLIAMILCSDLKHRVQRCWKMDDPDDSYKKCKGYFLLGQRQALKTFSKPEFCCKEHRQFYTATQHVKASRRQLLKWRIERAAAYVAASDQTPGASAWADSLKKDLAKHLNTRCPGQKSTRFVKQAWITRHVMEIESAAQEIRNGLSPTYEPVTRSTRKKSRQFTNPEAELLKLSFEHVPEHFGDETA